MLLTNSATHFADIFSISVFVALVTHHLGIADGTNPGLPFLLMACQAEVCAGFAFFVNPAREVDATRGAFGCFQ